MGADLAETADEVIRQARFAPRAGSPGKGRTAGRQASAARESMTTSPTHRSDRFTVGGAALWLRMARILLGIMVGAFGVRYLVTGRPVNGLPPVPFWIPGGPALAYPAGLLLLGAGLLLLSGVGTRITATLLGCFLVFCALLHLTHLRALLLDGSMRTGFLEPLALGCICWVLAGAVAPVRSDPGPLLAALPSLGRYIFAGTLLIFGFQHFEYLGFLTNLIPGWLHFPAFWVVLTGLALILAGLAIAVRVLDRSAGLGLALMFLLWVLVLHGPLIAAHLHSGDQWTSGFVAIGFLAGGLVIAATSAPGATSPGTDAYRRSR